MSCRLSRRSLFASGGAAALAIQPALSQTAWAQETAANDASLAEAIDAYVKKAMAAWPEQPALGIAVVKDGAPVLTRGYGVKAQGKPAKADEHTLFAIASNSKNVTAAALAILVDEGKVKWDAPIKTYLPDFRLVDP